MNPRRRLGLFALPLCAAAMGWWGLRINRDAIGPRRAVKPSVDALAAPWRGEAAAAALNDDTAPVRDESSDVIARRAAKMNRAEVVRRLGKLSAEELRGEEGRLLVRRWAELDPSAAGQWVAQLAVPETRRELSSPVALGWAGTDFNGALAWVHSLPVDDTSREVLTVLSYELARSNPVESLKLAAQLPAGAASDEALLHALRQCGGKDLEFAQASALRLPAGELRERALSAVATLMADDDSNRAVQFALAQMVSGLEQNRTIAGIVQRWAQVDYQRTLASVSGFPSALHEVAIEALVALPPESLSQF
jgi:hypothetical protein